MSPPGVVFFFLGGEAEDQEWRWHYPLPCRTPAPWPSCLPARFTTIRGIIQPHPKPGSPHPEANQGGGRGEKRRLLGEKRGQHSFPISITNQATVRSSVAQGASHGSPLPTLKNRRNGATGRRKDTCILKGQRGCPFGVAVRSHVQQSPLPTHSCRGGSPESLFPSSHWLCFSKSSPRKHLFGVGGKGWWWLDIATERQRTGMKDGGWDQRRGKGAPQKPSFPLPIITEANWSLRKRQKEVHLW